jgi:2-keto-4-pentenoate hydratase/2-oxohepta-3-ene-1,7-dioic acid hydratase in catechol pathway
VKIAAIGPVGAERLAVMIDDTSAVFVDDVVPRLDRETIGSGALAALAACDVQSRPVVDVTDQRFGAPIARPTKVVCIGLNYREHAIESGAEIPKEPVIFMKAPDTVQGPNDDIKIPPNSTATDYEVELAIVIGERCSYLPSQEAASSVIAGYTMSQDVSERHWQLERGGQWDKGKSFPTFNPLGPFLVTPDEFDPSDARLWCRIDGEIRQDSSTSDLIFDVNEIVRYVSNVMELFPGDIINTGTPQGVGLGWKPPRYLVAGNVVETGIEGLGTQHANVVATQLR